MYKKSSLFDVLFLSCIIGLMPINISAVVSKGEFHFAIGMTLVGVASIPFAWNAFKEMCRLGNERSILEKQLFKEKKVRLHTATTFLGSITRRVTPQWVEYPNGCSEKDKDTIAREANEYHRVSALYESALEKEGFLSLLVLAGVYVGPRVMWTYMRQR